MTHRQSAIQIRECNKIKIPYMIMVGLSLHNSNKPLSIKQIYRFIKYYFAESVTASSWKTSVGRELRTNRLFKKQDGFNGFLWAIDNDHNGILWRTITTFAATNCDRNFYGMNDPSLWEKLLEGSLGTLDENIQINIGNFNRPSKSRKKQTNRHEGQIHSYSNGFYAAENMNFYGYHQPSQMPEYINDLYGFQLPIDGYDYPIQQTHSYPNGFYAAENMNFYGYNQPNQMPEYINDLFRSYS